jgi:hypothetical protein
MTPPKFRRSGETSAAREWATAAPGHADQLRRGAWYPIVEEDNDGHIVVEVDFQPVRVRREDVVTRDGKPEMWSVVVRTGVLRPTLAGQKVVTRYAVCPDCCGRQEFEDEPETLMCTRCRRAAKVDWSRTF